MFQKATRKQAYLRLALTGPSGAGKTYSALLLAKGLGGNIAFIDTEHGSGSLYSDLVDFDVVSLEAPFSPERYIEAIDAAIEEGYGVLIIDSITHEWNGKGGILEIVDTVTKASNSKNSYFAWGEATPRHNAFIEKILQSPIHVIAAMRSKQDFILTEVRGKQVPKKVGLAPIQREGMEYEFTSVLDLTQGSNLATVSKDRTRIWGIDPFLVTEEDGQKLIEWLNSGVSFDEANESQKVDLLTVIADAEDMEVLKGIYTSAVTWSRQLQSDDYETEFTAAKDKRKTELEQPPYRRRHDKFIQHLSTVSGCPHGPDGL